MISCCCLESQFFPGFRRGDASFRSAYEVAFLDQERFVNVFDRTFFFSYGNGDVLQAHRTAAEVGDDDFKDSHVHVIQPVTVDLKHFQCLLGDPLRNNRIRPHLGVVARPAQEVVGNAGRAAAASGDFGGAFRFDGDAENARGTGDDLRQAPRIIVIQSDVESEAGTQRCGDHPLSGGGSDQREMRYIQPDRARPGPLFKHDIDEKILHGAVEVFLHSGIEAMDFVDEEDVSFLQGSQEAGKVSGFFDRGPAGTFQVAAAFVGDDVGQSGFSESRRTGKQDMVQCLSPFPGGVHEEFELILDFVLPRKVGETGGTQSVFPGRVAFVERGSDESFGHVFSKIRLEISASAVLIISYSLYCKSSGRNCQCLDRKKERIFPMYDQKRAARTADAVRGLAADAIQKARSGHPGMPLGCADFAVTLWAKYLRFNPRNPGWIGRDRFVLSAGHGSMLQYALLHLFECGLTMEDLKNFRQWGSLTPGHPEYGHTAGVDITTGPLGSGFASAVGMAMAEKYFAARTGLEASGLPENRIFVISGDGCMMEGCTAEAASLAGNLRLGNLIVFYDDNAITIEGDTALAFSEDVGKRFEAYGWRVLRIADANDPAQCDAGLAEAVAGDGRPTLLIGKTRIGFGAPNKEGKACTHGEPLGEEEVAALKQHLGLPAEPFTVEPDVYAFCHERAVEAEADAAAWDKRFQAFVEADPERARLMDSLLNRRVPAGLKEEFLKVIPVDKPAASRAAGGAVLQKAAELVPALWGGAADLAPSTKTAVKNGGSFSAENRLGRNIHFGIRELAMGLAGNGMALQGSVIPYTSTFFVFSDYMKPAIRLAALQKLHEIYVFTHDSFYVGEDGPTHEPIEQIAMLRSIPGLTVIRPAEAHEVAQAWAVALETDGPVVLLLTRQDLAPFTPEQAREVAVERGAYVLSDDEDFDLILIATGSEVNLALQTADMLRKLEVRVRVVSMPSQELFLKQDEEYRESVLPSWCGCRVSLEAASTFGWQRFIGIDGLAIGLDHFGASAPYKVLAEKFGFTPEAVVQRISEHFVRYEDEDEEEGDECGCGCGCHHHHED